jgi:hypothetical protein
MHKTGIDQLLRSATKFRFDEELSHEDCRGGRLWTLSVECSVFAGWKAPLKHPFACCAARWASPEAAKWTPGCTRRTNWRRRVSHDRRRRRRDCAGPPHRKAQEELWGDEARRPKWRTSGRQAAPQRGSRLSPMLRPTATNPVPKNAIQNTCHGIHGGISVPMGARARKCSTPNTMRDTASR